MRALIDARIARALGRVRLAFRALLTRLNTAPAVQLAQADACSGEQVQDAELMQQYGYTSAPPPGTMLLVLPLGGRTAHGIAIATEHAGYRLRGLQSGEVALYTDEGDHVTLKRGRVVEIVTQSLSVHASTEVTFNTPLVRIAGGELRVDLDITDGQASDPKTMAGMRAVYNVHTHADPQGGSVGTPTGQM